MEEAAKGRARAHGKRDGVALPVWLVWRVGWSATRYDTAMGVIV